MPACNTCGASQDDIYFCANSINSGKYAYNNLNAYYFTWYHKINATWHTATESWYQYERDTPNLNNPNVGLIGSSVPDPLLIFGANGARCNNTTETTCFAPEWAMVNYLEEQLGPHNYISIRNEVFDDIRGQRTGTKGLVHRTPLRLGPLDRHHHPVAPRGPLGTHLQPQPRFDVAASRHKK